MSRRLVLGVFENESGLLAAVRKSRARGLKVLDAYSPYAIHGLDDAMGLRPSRLPWICFAAAVTGAALKLWFEYWVTMVDWPLNVGGKPWNSLPAFVPVTFEVMVLSAGLTTVFTFFLISRLRPGKKAVSVHRGVTDNRFVVVLEETDAAFDLPDVRKMFELSGAVAV